MCLPIYTVYKSLLDIRPDPDSCRYKTNVSTGTPATGTAKATVIVEEPVGDKSELPGIPSVVYDEL